MGGDLATSLGGGGRKYRCGPNFQMTFLKEKIAILTPKISDGLLIVVIDHFCVFS